MTIKSIMADGTQGIQTAGMRLEIMDARPWNNTLKDDHLWNKIQYSIYVALLTMLPYKPHDISRDSNQIADYNTI